MLYHPINQGGRGLDKPIPPWLSESWMTREKSSPHGLGNSDARRVNRYNRRPGQTSPLHVCGFAIRLASTHQGLITLGFNYRF